MTGLFPRRRRVGPVEMAGSLAQLRPSTCPIVTTHTVGVSRRGSGASGRSSGGGAIDFIGHPRGTGGVFRLDLTRDACPIFMAQTVGVSRRGSGGAGRSMGDESVRAFDQIVAAAFVWAVNAILAMSMSVPSMDVVELCRVGSGVIGRSDGRSHGDAGGFGSHGDGGSADTHELSRVGSGLSGRSAGNGDGGSSSAAGSVVVTSDDGASM